jgi:NAD(P)-dependent dehydrogenase (short-subunit alcohol dehydrogenase family)
VVYFEQLLLRPNSSSVIVVREAQCDRNGAYSQNKDAWVANGAVLRSARDSDPTQLPRTIAVLGGAGGIGRAVVRRLQLKGDEVIVLDTPVAMRRYPPSVCAIPMDIRSESDVAAAAEQVHRKAAGLDGMVCISGILGKKQLIKDLDFTEFDEIMRVNLRGLLFASKTFMPLLENRDAASLVIMSSAIIGRTIATYGAYTMSKAGLIALTKQLAVEHAPRVRVNAVAPAVVDTAFSRGGTGSNESGVQTDYESLLKLIPLGRVATPDDIAGPIDFLLSHDSRYMTGQVLWITGGMVMP